MNNYFKFALLFVAFVANITLSGAQPEKKERKSREEFAEMQAKHIAYELAFDEATTKKFTTAFCEYQKEIWAIDSTKHEKRKHITDNEEETEKVIKERFAKSQKILEIRERYYVKYSEFLTQKQIERVYQLEREMMNRLVKNHEKGQGRSSNNHNGKN